MRLTFLSLFLLTWHFSNAYCINQPDTIFVLKDSTIDSKSGVHYKYKIIRQHASNADVLYVYETQTVSLVETDLHRKNKLNYIAFTFYDEPTGRVFLLLYDFVSKKLYKTDWFDDNATGDKVIQDQVYFKKGLIIVKESESLKDYTVKMGPIPRR